PNTFSEAEQYQLAYNPLFYPPEERYNAIVEKYPVIKEDPSKQQQLNSLVNSVIEVVPVVYPGQGFFADVYKVQGKNRTRISSPNEIFLGETYNPQDFLRKQVQ